MRRVHGHWSKQWIELTFAVIRHEGSLLWRQLSHANDTYSLVVQCWAKRTIPAAVLIAHELVCMLCDKLRFLTRGTTVWPGLGWPSSIRCIRPPTRISKNSSRLRAVMARNLTRSKRGLRGFSASSSTRRLNASHEDSRLSTREGSSRERLTIERRVSAQFPPCYTRVT